MLDAELRELTASDALTLDEEYDMQRTLRLLQFVLDAAFTVNNFPPRKMADRRRQ